MFRLFGVSLLTLVVANLALLAVLLALLYAILRRMGSRLGATVGCLVVLLVFAFSRYERITNFNFICPYTHSATHGLILGVAAIYFMARYHGRPSAAWASAAGLALGLAFLTKPRDVCGCGRGGGGWTSARRLGARVHRGAAGARGGDYGRVGGAAGAGRVGAPLPGHAGVRCPSRSARSWWYLFNSRITSLPFYKWAWVPSTMRRAT